MTTIIDTHQHLWDLSRFRLPWLAGGGKLARSHLMEEYLRETAGLGIEKTIYMEVDVAPEQHEAEAAWVTEQCHQTDNPMVAGVIGGRPGSPGFDAYARKHAAFPEVKGVRQVLHGGTAKGTCLAETFVRDIRLLGDLGLRFDLCVRPDDIPDGARLADACPGTRFILDHCGNPNWPSGDLGRWRADMREIAKRPNIVVKISGIMAAAMPGEWTMDQVRPVIEHTVEAFGIERAMFASDWPVCTLAVSLKEWVEILREVTSAWPETDRRRLFHDNAAAFYDV